MKYLHKTKRSKSLRTKIIKTLIEQGLEFSPHLQPKDNSKLGLKTIQAYGKRDVLKRHAKFLNENKKLISEYSLDGKYIIPDEIKLELREVQPNSIEAKLFLWWNISWWSIPYAHPVGRQLRFIIWDKFHDIPFGLIGLSSPPLRMSTRDSYLGIPNDKISYWINMSLNGQRIGALPPYNELLGGKLVASSLTSNEIRESYSTKYRNKISLKEKKKIPPKLFFIITTSAFGKSSMYDRIQYCGKRVEKFLGFTKGMGSFHLKKELYNEMIQYLISIGKDTDNILGGKSSRKIKLIHTAFDELGIKRKMDGEGIKRGIYLFSNVSNLIEVIRKNKKPDWYDRPFEHIQKYWLNRYAIPRSRRNNNFQKFDARKFIQNIQKQI